MKPEEMEELKSTVIILEKLATTYKTLMDVQGGSGMGLEFNNPDAISQKKIIEENLILQKSCHDIIREKLSNIKKGK